MDVMRRRSSAERAPALLQQLADVMNACEASGVLIKPAHGAILTQFGYLFWLQHDHVGDGGSWQVRTRRLTELALPDDDDLT
jgi:hypothetical protein